MGDNTHKPKTGLVRKRDQIELLTLADLVPARVNDAVYKPVDPSDPAVQDLAAKIQKQGLLEPIVVTLDNVILSGHRRRVACQLAGLEVVRVRRDPVRSDDSRFLELLVSYNTQRVKSVDEQLREAVVTASKADAYSDLVKYRNAAARRPIAQASGKGLSVRAVDAARKRSEITAAKRPMLDAAIAVLHANRDYWPLTVRQVHYRLLNNPPLRHASKPGSAYVNDKNSYNDLSDLLSRSRFTGEVDWDSIYDPTRPQIQWRVWRDAGPFINQEVNNFLRGYHRDLLQSQSAHYEIVGEKITAQNIIERAASGYSMPFSIGRGYSSVDLRHQIAERYFDSGKGHMILLLVNDFDPEGENITSTLASSLRDEFGITNISPIKVALTSDQVQQFHLPPGGAAKDSSSRAKGFKKQHGNDVYELEALSPADLTQIIREAIEGVLDMKLFEAERDREADDAAHLAACRGQMRSSLAVKPD